MTPKFHLWVHLTMQMCVHGNPKYYSTFIDEGLNGTIKQIARHCHPLTFSETVFRRVLLGDPIIFADR